MGPEKHLIWNRSCCHYLVQINFVFCLFWFKKGDEKNSFKLIFDTYIFYGLNSIFGIREKMKHSFQKKNISTWFSPEYYLSQLTNGRREAISKLLSLEIMTFPNSEGAKINFVYPLFDSKAVIK